MEEEVDLLPDDALIEGRIVGVEAA